MSFINMEQDTGKGGGGPEDDARYAIKNLRTHGLLSLAFGTAVGFACVVLYLMLISLNLQGEIGRLFSPKTLTFVKLAVIFIFGFLSGTMIAMVYNWLVVRRINLFGLESTID